MANDDPLKGISIVGPLIGNEHWPHVSLSHLSDRPDYRPPAGVALSQLLDEHNPMGDARLSDGPIAGATAVHLRHDRSPQSYGHGRYYFAHSSQLYMIVIGHAGDKEDRELYRHFLEGIQIDGWRMKGFAAPATPESKSPAFRSAILR